MVFDSTYTFIVRGSVQTLVLHSENVHELSTFGLDLIYINAAIHDSFAHVLQTFQDHNNNDDDDNDPIARYQEFTRIRGELQKRWNDEGVSVRTRAMLNKVLTRIVGQQEATPVHFLA